MPTPNATAALAHAITPTCRWCGAITGDAGGTILTAPHWGLSASLECLKCWREEQEAIEAEHWERWERDNAARLARIGLDLDTPDQGAGWTYHPAPRGGDDLAAA